MVAYSFKARFAEPILAGTKRQTIRADRRRHARPGEVVQLYTGMRTRQCRLIGRAVCLQVTPVSLYFNQTWGGDDFVHLPSPAGFPTRPDPIIQNDAFARDDGFADWAALRAFWAENHPGVDVFHGVLIVWGELGAAPAESRKGDGPSGLMARPAGGAARREANK